jgi:2-oxo-3-hexenedioate decarboxylase
MSDTQSTAWGIRRGAEVLLAAEADVQARGPVTEEWPELDLETAYAVQDEALRMRRARGETLIGVKLGLTSKAKQRRMGIDRPSLAWLTDAMVHPAGNPLPLGRLIHPRVEPEIGFVVGSRLAGPGVTSVTALAAVSHVFGAVEIIDSRFSGFQFQMADAVADNGSSALFTLGSVIADPTGLDLALETVLLEQDGEIVDSATGAAVQGNPGEALALAANILGERGLAIEPGWIVLTGGMTDALPIGPGRRIAAHFAHLGSVVAYADADADADAADAGN